ncbi:MAG: hypothetical protein LBC87_07110, partial [Fibromonadaceae bacterium]|nr:hypothetical protein [Fibromonadaceae bacterium]
MADIFQNNEIKGLNEILKKLRDGKELTSLNDFPNTDIVFVAGLFLWYKQYKKYDIEIQGLIRRSDYFEQLEKLYGFSHNQIFEEEQFETKIYSPNYIPPIYITEKTLDCFFKDDKENIMYVMNKYKDNFDILDFIDKRTSNYQNSIKKFSEYEIEIKQRLEKFSPIFTFIFIVASKNLATKKDEAFDDI